MWTTQRTAFLVIAFAATACGTSNDLGSSPTDKAPTLVGTVNLEIGVESGDEPYLFGTVTGVASDDGGRIFVADAQADEVRVFDADGVFQQAIGGGGQGPGEFNQPCCPAIGPAGRVWARDGGNSRYQGFAAQNEGYAFDASIPIGHPTARMRAPLKFDNAGNLVDVGQRNDPEGTQPRTVRFHLSAQGEVVSDESVTQPDPGEIGMHVIEGTGWPANVRLGSGWIKGDTALGTLSDEAGFTKIVRVRFGPQEESR